VIANRALRRRVAVGAVVTAMVAVAPVTASLEAGASDAPLGSANVRAVATGLRMPLYSHAGEDVEAELPYSLSELGAGGVGHALTSIVWPGDTGGHGGSTVGVLSGSLPAPVAALLDKLTPVVNALNDPYKAEAPTTTGETKVSLSNPGLIMQSLALPTHVNASSAVGPSSLSSFKDDAGPLVTATTNITQGLHSATVDAKTALTDISIGPLFIGSLVSTAHATSDGTHASGTTTTQISGVKIAGIDVTIDQNGVQLAKKGILPASVFDTLSKTVASALKTIGIEIYFVPSTKSVAGPQVSIDSGDLVLALNNPGYKHTVNDTTSVIQLGGVSIRMNASPGYVAPVIPPSPIASSSTPPGGTTVPGFTPPPTGPEGVETSPSVAPPLLAANPVHLPGALSAWWIVGALLLALLLAFLLGMLPGRAFAAGDARCSLEEDS
jgi:hypothetical protein